MITHKHKSNRSNFACALVSIFAFFISDALYADSDAVFVLDINEQNAGAALMKLAETSGAQIVFSQEISRNVHISPLSGEYTLTSALNQMLKGSGLRYELLADDSVVITQGETQDKKEHSGRLSTKILEEVVITAQKREQRLIDVPMSIAALSQRQMAEAGITDLQSLSFAVPGVLVAETGTQRRISIRGIGNLFGSSSLVGVYLDEAAVAGFPDQQLDLRVHDLERVEVLKGPQGTLYGEGAVGGAIRYITRDPQLEGFSGDLSLDASSTESGGSSHEVKSVLNLPLADNLGLRFAGQYANAGGWVDQPASGKKDINDYELFNVRTKLLWQPTDNMEIKSTVIVHRNAGATNISDENGDYHQAFDDPSTPSIDDEYNFYNLTATYDMGPFNLVSSTGYLDANKMVTNSGGRCCSTDPDQVPHSLLNNFRSEAEILTQELRIATDGSGPWNGVVGLFYKDATLPIAAGQILFGRPGGTLGVDLFEINEIFVEENSQSWALFGETSYAVTQRLEVGAGLRYFEDDREQQSPKNGPIQKGSFDSLNPKIYLSYAVTEDVRIYANVAKGFRSGGFNAGNRPPYDPESVWSYELGSKMSLMDRRLNAEWALFYTDYDDYQIVGRLPGEPVEGANSFIFNAGNAEIQGIDVSLMFFATDRLEMGFNGSYMDTEFVKIKVAPGSSSHAVGDPLDLVPQYSYTVWGNYSFNWFDDSPGYIRLDYNRQGKSHYRERAISPDYHNTSDILDMVNARVGWENGNWSLELYALNLLDEEGFIGPLSLANIASQPRPRTIGLNVDVKF